jgi:hypothetical protein
MSFYYQRIPTFDCDTESCLGSFAGKVNARYATTRAQAIEVGWVIPRSGPASCPNHARQPPPQPSEATPDLS